MTVCASVMTVVGAAAAPPAQGGQGPPGTSSEVVVVVELDRLAGLAVAIVTVVLAGRPAATTCVDVGVEGEGVAVLVSGVPGLTAEPG